MFTFRPFVDDDLEHLLAHDIEANAEIGIRSAQTAEELRAELDVPGYKPSEMIVIAEVEGAVAGHGLLWAREDSVHIHGYVAQPFRGNGIGTAVLDWGIAWAKANNDTRTVMAGAALARADAIALIEGHAAGFRPARTFYRMVHAAPATIAEPVWPAGIELRVLEGDALLDALIDAHDRSFADHWNFHPLNRDEFGHYLAQPDQDPNLVYIAYAGNEIAGFSYTWLETGVEPPVGIVGLLGTVPAFRGIGLGRALLRHGVGRLAARGAGEVELGVDAINPSGAVRLYKSNGFAVTHERRVYQMPV